MSLKKVFIKNFKRPIIFYDKWKFKEHILKYIPLYEN